MLKTFGYLLRINLIVGKFPFLGTLNDRIFQFMQKLINVYCGPCPLPLIHNVDLFFNRFVKSYRGNPECVKIRTQDCF